jgi:hypothetical protein
MCSQKNDVSLAERAEQFMREESKRQKQAVDAFISACKGTDPSAVKPALHALREASAFELALREACKSDNVPSAIRCQLLCCLHSMHSQLCYRNTRDLQSASIGEWQQRNGKAKNMGFAGHPSPMSQGNLLGASAPRKIHTIMTAVSSRLSRQKAHNQLLGNAG